MTVTDANFATTLWNDLRAVIAAGAPYTTNPTTTATSACVIKATYNDKNDPVPMIVIAPIAINQVYDKFGGTNGKKEFSTNIRVITQFTSGCDQLDEQLCALISADSIVGVNLVSYTSVFDIPTDPFNVKFHSKTISVAYNRE